MIARLWRSRYKEGFERFVETELLPELEKRKGCRYAVAAVKDGEMVVLSVWSDSASLEAFVGKAPAGKAVLPGAQKYLVGKAEVEHLEIVGTLDRSGGPGKAL